MEEVPAVEKVVESRGPKKGVLLIDGGGSDAKVDYTGPPTMKIFTNLAKETSSKKFPNIVVIATAQGENVNNDTVQTFKAVVKFQKFHGKDKAKLPIAKHFMT